MYQSLLLLSVLAIAQPQALGVGDHERSITVDKVTRKHHVHVPPKYDAKKPMPVVLALHGAIMDGKTMEYFCGLNKTADEQNFIVVYPNGVFLTWNAGLFPGELAKQTNADDVKYLGKVLDDVESVLKVDKKRVYATGMSNGGMMCYRLAAEMSDRIAAIAPVGGTMALEKYEPKQPVPVVHFHGTKDTLVPYEGPAKLMRFRSVDDTMRLCVKANGCEEKATESVVEVKDEKLKITRKLFSKGKADVVLYTIENGGHVWFGMQTAPAFLGPTTLHFSANDVMWAFFKMQALK
jgi:polyhydroxybutyrate depolymerase